MANDFLSALFNAISNSSGSGGNNWSDNAKKNSSAQKNSSTQKKNNNGSSSNSNGSSQKSQASVKSTTDTSDKSSSSTVSTSTPKASSSKTANSFSPNTSNTVDTSDLYQATPSDIASAATKLNHDVENITDGIFGIRQANADNMDTSTGEWTEPYTNEDGKEVQKNNKTGEERATDAQVHKNVENDPGVWDRYTEEQLHKLQSPDGTDDPSLVYYDSEKVRKFAKAIFENDESLTADDAIRKAIEDYEDLYEATYGKSPDESSDDSTNSNDSTKKSSDGRSTLKYVDRTKEWIDNSEVGQAYLKSLPSSIQKEYKRDGAWAIIRTMEDAAYGHALNSKQYTDLMNYVDSSGGTAVQDNIDAYKDYDGKGTSIDLNGDGKLTEDEVDAWNTWSRENNTDSDATTWYNGKANVDEQHTQAYQNYESSYIANLYANLLEGQDGPTMTTNEDGSIVLSDGDNYYDLTATQAEMLDNLITKDNYKDFQATDNDALMDAKGYWTDAYQNFNNLMSADKMLNANYKKDSNGSYSVNTDRFGNLSDEAVANMINTLDGTTYGVTSYANAKDYKTASDSTDSFDQIINAFSNWGAGSTQSSDPSRQIIKGTYNPDTVSDSIGKLYSGEDLSYDDVYNLMGEDGVTYQDGTGALYTTT